MEQSEFGIVPLILFAILYAFSAYTLMLIARKTNLGQKGWWAWVPVLNIILMLQIGQKPVWWIVLMIIPFINLIFIGLTWGGICKARNKNAWLGILVLVPFANLALMGYLAFAD